MSLDFLDISQTAQPQKNALIVCAGTVTCERVTQMNAGFNLFKKIFNTDIACDNASNIREWSDILQKHLNEYHSKEQAMPPYIRIAQKDTYIGGVATVPCLPNSGLTHEEHQDFDQQYKSAVIKAIQDARELKRPLFLQPLGIGVYGWKPEKAAQLFFEAICETDPNNEVHITIPIYDQNKYSADKTFENTLQLKMNERLNNNPVDKMEIESIDLNNDSIYKTALSKIKELLNSDDWAKTKRNTLFASKPTSVRKMLAIIQRGEKNALTDEKILNQLKDYLIKRKDSWLTNPDAQQFYQKLKTILSNDLKKKKYDLKGLKVIQTPN